MLDFYFDLELYFALFRLISEYSYIPDACVTKQLLIFNDLRPFLKVWTCELLNSLSEGSYFCEQPTRTLIFLWADGKSH